MKTSPHSAVTAWIKANKKYFHQVKNLTIVLFPWIFLTCFSTTSFKVRIRILYVCFTPIHSIPHLDLSSLVYLSKYSVLFWLAWDLVRWFVSHRAFDGGSDRIPNLQRLDPVPKLNPHPSMIPNPINEILTVKFKVSSSHFLQFFFWKGISTSIAKFLTPVLLNYVSQLFKVERVADVSGLKTLISWLFCFCLI